MLNSLAQCNAEDSVRKSVLEQISKSCFSLCVQALHPAVFLFVFNRCTRAAAAKGGLVAAWRQAKLDKDNLGLDQAGCFGLVWSCPNLTPMNILDIYKFNIYQYIHK